MNFAPSEWFGFNKRVKQDMVFTKTENGETSTKKVYGRFNLWAFLFTWFYGLFSRRCQIPFFMIKTAVPFMGLIFFNTVIQLIFTEQIALTINVLGAIWYGFMFETWFKNQLIADGYQPVQ